MSRDKTRKVAAFAAGLLLVTAIGNAAVATVMTDSSAVDGDAAVVIAGPGSVTRTFTVGSDRVASDCPSGAAAPTDGCWRLPVTVAAGRPLAIRVSSNVAAGMPSPVSDIDLSLGDSEARELVSSRSTTREESFAAVLDDGSYSLLVAARTAAAGTEVTVSFDATEPAPADEAELSAIGEEATVTGPLPEGDPETGCRGVADPACTYFAVTVSATGPAMLRLGPPTSTEPLDQATAVLYDGHQRELARSDFAAEPEDVAVTGPGTFWVQAVPATSASGTSARNPASTGSVTVPVSLAAASGAGGTPIGTDPDPGPPDTGLFTRTHGFATKTGFRGVFTWQASQLVAGVVHYGRDPSRLDLIAQPSGGPDTAQVVTVDGLEQGAVYYWQVEDVLTGERSVVRALRAANAYNDWNGSTYTVDLLVQIDSQSLPPDVPQLVALQDAAQGVSILAERLWDATDGYARVGNVVVTDTNLDDAANQPNVPVTAPVVCAEGNVADALIQTTVPFDSHSYAYAVAEPCASFNLGRVGQLGGPWVDDLHLGYIATHEMLHYAFGAPDLYDLATIALPEGTGCHNFEWDGSLMYNRGGWNPSAHRWELTELDRNPTLTPCDMLGRPYSWDAIRSRYTNVPALPDGPIQHVFDTAARGNVDGGALSITILDREPATSMLSSFTPIDDDEPGAWTPVCASPVASDGPGDAHLATPVAAGPSDDGLDLRSVDFLWTGSGVDVVLSVEDLAEARPTTSPLGDAFFVNFSLGGKAYTLIARRSATAPPRYALEDPLADPTADRTIADDLVGRFDAAANTVTVTLPADVFSSHVEGAPVLAAGVTFSRIEAMSGRPLVAVIRYADYATATCDYTILPPSVEPEPTCRPPGRPAAGDHRKVCKD